MFYSDSYVARFISLQPTPDSCREAAKFSRSNVLPHTTSKMPFWGLNEHLLVLMFPRHKVTSASRPACLLLFVQRSTEGRAHWRQRWCHHCDHYCAVWCPIFDQASLRAGQNVCLRTARRNSGLPVLINAAPVFISLKIVLMPPPQAHLRLRFSSSTNGSFKPTEDVFSTSLSTTIKDLFSILGTYWTNMDTTQKSQTSNIKALCYSVTLPLHSCAPHSTTKK